MTFQYRNGVLAMQSMKMSEGGRVVIPSEIRQALGVKEGDSLLIELVDGEARITTRAARLKRAQALIRQYVPEGVSLADELIAERRAAAEQGD
jgi:AbrB family looped-hinge helix DNA binding protein